MVIDVHAHIYPDNIAEKAAMNIGYFYDKHMTNPNGSVKRLLEIGDRAGVDKFVVHSAATTPHQVKSINNFIKASVLAHPDRFVGLCTIHPGMEDPIAELERAKSLGLKGIKLHPDFQKFAITDSSMGPIYDFCQATGYPILFHTPIPASYPGFWRASPASGSYAPTSADGPNGKRQKNTFPAQTQWWTAPPASLP